jgi:hypothetical protein
MSRVSPERTSRAESEQRSAAPAGLAAAIRRNGMRVANDPDDIRRLVKALGPENARKILSDQLAAVRAMRESGNPTAGRVAQANRGLPIINDDMIDLAPYTYYQVAKG